MDRPNVFLQDICALTPSQLYISADKLAGVNKWFKGDVAHMDPIPIKRLAGRTLMTDGHTRAVAAWRAGLKSIPCVWDTDDLDWAAYAVDISMCAQEEITSVEKLACRVVSAEDYERLWIKRCDKLRDQWDYKVLTQKEEVIFFTRDHIEIPNCDIRRLQTEFAGEYYQLFCDDVAVARGCIEKYSYEFWEAADIKTYNDHRKHGFGYKITAYLTNLIIESGKTATCRTLPENAGMNRIIQKCGYSRLYD